MSDAARIAELERRLRDLERRVPSGLGAGAGLSTQLGTSVARPTQVGFPAKITDAFDASLGYAWEALVKETDPTVSAVASNPLTGVHAVALDNDETLAADTVVWLEPDPGGRGYLITNSSGGGSSVASWKHVVRAASTANGTLATAFEDGDALDGVTLATGDRILLKNQSTAADNGIYVVAASGAPARAADADGVDELVGARVWVSEGTKNADTEWTCTTNATITPGSTATTWVQTYPHAFLCEVTTSADPHTVEQKTYSGGAIADSSPAVSFSNCRATTGATSLPVGTVVTRSPLPDSAGNYWITPAGYASSTLPGLVSVGVQSFLGQKTFVNSATSGDALYVLGGGSGLMAGGGTGSGTYPLAVPTSEGSALSAATSPTPPDSTRDYLRLVGGSGTNTSFVATSPSPSAGSGADLWLIPGAASGAAGRSVSMGRFGYWNATDTKVYTGVSGSTMVGVDVQGGIVVGGTALADPNADRLVFWDDSAGALAYATPSGLEFSTTTFRLVDQGAVSDLSDMTAGTSDGTMQAVTDTTATDQSATINDNFADVAIRLNALLAKLRTAGIIS